MNNSTKIYVERLNQLVRVLREVRDKGRLFSLSTWATMGCDPTIERELPESACKTVACAIGWASQDPWFRRRGFCLIKEGTNSSYPRFKFRGETEKGWFAIRTFFDVTTSTADNLFSGWEYPKGYTAETVMKRVETYITYMYGEEALRKEVPA